MRSKVNTEAIILSTTNYRDTSLIFNVLTPELGLTGLIVNGVRKKKPKYRPALFQIFSILDIVIDHHPNRDLHRFTDLSCQRPLYNIYSDLKKSSIVFFLNELVNKCVRYPHEDEALFIFLKDSIISLENLKHGISTFHLQFMLKLISILGFHIENVRQIIDDIKKAKLVVDIPLVQANDYLNQLNQADFGDTIKISKSNKHELLEILLCFYQIHNDKPIKMKSFEILKNSLGIIKI